jgi:large subunit ribosomal protein L25
MAQQAKLTVQRRTATGRNHIKVLRSQGLVPGIIYGAKQEALPLTVDGKALSTVLSHGASENILVELEIVDGSNRTNALALIQEVQHHPLRTELLHIDFHAVSATEKVTTEVPVETLGESVGVKTFGGLLEHILRRLEVECLPKDLPGSIVVDVSNLNVGDSVHVRDLPLPTGVKTLTDPELTVVAVVEPRVEAEEAPAAVEAPTAPEVITAKKEETPGGETAAS